MGISIADELRLLWYFTISAERGGSSTFGPMLERLQNYNAVGQSWGWEWLDGRDAQVYVNKSHHTSACFEPDERRMMCVGQVSRRLIQASQTYTQASAVLAAYYGDRGHGAELRHKRGRIVSVYPLTVTAGSYVKARNKKLCRTMTAVEAVSSILAVHEAQNKDRALVERMAGSAATMYGMACAAYGVGAAE